ncbi:transposase [Rubritalea spongiae]|uniref:integrase core domain-containing protein n=1 Tax=Rubritalea spongiae TaxID=430797 RepID=UPI00361DC82D
MEQCYIESFHDKLRDEFLNREIFYSLAEAKILLEGWRKEYNDERIHSSLAYLTPNEFARSVQTPLRATPSTPSVRELIPNLIRNNIFTESTV